MSVCKNSPIWCFLPSRGVKVHNLIILMIDENDTHLSEKNLSPIPHLTISTTTKNNEKINSQPLPMIMSEPTGCWLPLILIKVEFSSLDCISSHGAFCFIHLLSKHKSYLKILPFQKIQSLVTHVNFSLYCNCPLVALSLCSLESSKTWSCVHNHVSSTIIMFWEDFSLKGFCSYVFPLIKNRKGEQWNNMSCLFNLINSFSHEIGTFKDKYQSKHIHCWESHPHFLLLAYSSCADTLIWLCQVIHLLYAIMNLSM